jgi:3-hydroxybutyryl-CoA dehydrogenase
MFDPGKADLKVGVIGAGAMGQGIVQVSLAGGMQVVLHDAKPGGAEAGIDAVRARLDREVSKGRLEQSAAAEMIARVTVADGLEGFAACDVVIEAVFEDLELKRSLFSKLEEHVRDDCVIASNTSSLLIASIARACKRRDRIAGMHFFNPVPVMRLVEIVRGPETAAAVAVSLAGLGERMGRTPVTVKDAPGFLVNHGGRAYTTEANRLLHERVGTPAQIDAIMRDCCGFRMGPCELMDLTGIDVNYPVSRIVYDGYSQDPRLRTYFPHLALFEAGRFGRKTGSGHYTYDDDGVQVDDGSADFQASAEPCARLIVRQRHEGVSEFAEEIKCPVSEQDDGESPVLVSLLGEDCSTYASRTGIDHRRLVAVDLYCTTVKRVTLMTSPGADAAALEAVAARVRASGRAVTAISDSPGFVAQRITAMIANLGCEMAQIGVATPHEIDLAMKLGLNYPKGPLEMAEDFGLENMHAALVRMQEITGEDRYRPSLWLRRRAQLGLACDTEN